MGPYDANPIPNSHLSPFMSREKPNAPNHRVIIFKNASVNAGVDKNSYLIYFHCVSDTMHYMLHCHGYRILNYCDDFVGYGTPDITQHSYDCLRHIIKRMGLSISEKKLVAPTTSAVCLGVLIGTIKGTVTIPDEKMRQIKQTITE